MGAMLTAQERESLTFWGTTISAQVRGEGRVALHVYDEAPRLEGPGQVVEVSPDDASKLADLLAEARRRGMVLGSAGPVQHGTVDQLIRDTDDD